jgi:hypothetical protein
LGGGGEFLQEIRLGGEVLCVLVVRQIDHARVNFFLHALSVSALHE